MLYDPKWERKTETKADPLTLAALIAWLELQPANSEYCYMETGHCLLAKYFQEQGLSRTVGGFDYQPIGGGERKLLPDHFNNIAVHGERTYGAALKRARDIADAA